MSYTRLLMTCVVLMSGSVMAADIYQSTDAQGNIIYSDRPDGTDQQPLITTAGRMRYPDRVAPAEPAPASDDDGDDDDDDANVNPMVALCESAKQIRDSYESASRLAEKNDDGTTRVLSDEEMRLAILRAREDVSKYCGANP